MPKQYFNPPTLFPSQQYGFSQIVTSSGGTTVYLSGQVAWNAEQQLTAADETTPAELDLATQTNHTLRNIAIALATVGGTLDDVVSLRIYLVGSAIHNSAPIREGLLAFFNPERLPSSTWIGVSALANPDFLIEIEATAVLEASE